MKKAKLFLYLLATALLWNTTACRHHKAQSLSSDDVLALSQYITGYTSGVLPRDKAVLVRFVAPHGLQPGAPADPELITISPKTKGRLYWKDAYTLAFQPDDWWPAGKQFFVTVRPGKLIRDVPSSLQKVEFSFSTLPLKAALEMDPPFMQEEADDHFTLRGILQTTDLLTKDFKRIEQALTVKGAGKPTIKWQHQGTVHNFLIQGLPAKTKTYRVEVTWNGRDLGVDKLQQTMDIPGTGSFRVVNMTVDKGKRSNFSIYFSNALKKQQYLNGLIAISGYGGAINSWVEGNRIHVQVEHINPGPHTVTVHKGIKNKDDTPLGEDYTGTLTFNPEGPMLRLVGNGVIVPRKASKALFPFEAVSLKYVDVEIFKIFTSNILQFLQKNELDGDTELKHVGRIIYRQKVALSNLNPEADYNQWTHYALDLSKIVDRDPKAIYQVRIAFRPAYSTYPCAPEGRAPDVQQAFADDYIAPLPSSEDQDFGNSILGDYYGYAGYFEDYDWSLRDDPCFREYYNQDHFIARNLYLSDLGIIAKTTDKGRHIFVAVNDINDTRPLRNVDVSFYDFQQQLITKATTDARGIVNTELVRPAYFVKAQAGDKLGYLRLAPGGSLFVSRFDVEGEVVQKNSKAFVYSDRGVYRPGDSIYLNLILRQDNELPDKYPVTLQLFDARNQLYLTKTIGSHLMGLYDFRVATRADAPTGLWRAVFDAGGARFSKAIRIETVKPNRLKIETDLPDKLTAATAGRRTRIQVKWLHGAPAASSDVSVSRQLQVAKSAFPNYLDYRFDDPTRAKYYSREDVFNGKTDANGIAFFKDDFAEGRDFPGMMKVAYLFKATERSGDFSTRNQTVAFSPYDTYAGIWLPEKYGYHKLELDRKNTIKVVALTAGGKPVPARKLELALYRLDWSWWWDGYDNISDFNNSDYATPIQTTKVITNSKGQATWEVTPPDWGRYLIRVFDPQNGQSAADIAYAGMPDSYNATDRRQLQAAAMLPLEVEQPSYQVGQTVQVKMPPSNSGTLLVTLEKRGRIIQSFRREAAKAKNTISFEATEDMTPNVYCAVSLIQPFGQRDNDRPLRMYGIVPVRIENPKQKLNPVIKTAKQWKPDSEVTIAVSENNGRPMAYTISIVDDGLLDLTNFKTPDPYKAFNAKEALQIRTWDVYDFILDNFSDVEHRILALGGDEDITVDPEKANNANRFKPVVLHLGPFQLPAGKTTQHKIHMPNYVGSVRVMVVATDAGRAFGSADQSVLVKKPLMVQPTMPRVLGTGETLSLPVTVFAMENNIHQATVTVKETTGRATFPQGNTRTVRFDRPGDKVVYFPVRLKNSDGIAHFRFNVVSGTHKASDEIEIEVHNPNPPVTAGWEQKLPAAASLDETIEPLGSPGSNETTVEVYAVPPIDLQSRLSFLIHYPYGCVEQTTSSVFPQLYVSDMMHTDERTRAKITTNVTAGIQRLRRFQTPDGGFAYWPGGRTSDDWATNYAGHFLLEAKNKGFALPPGMLDHWLDYQRHEANNWVPRFKTQYDYNTQAYRLYSLALAGKPAKGAMNRLRQLDLPDNARYLLAAAYSLTGNTATGKKLLAAAKFTFSPYRELAYSYGSDLRDRAIALLAADALRASRATELLEQISRALNSDQWYSTHSTAFALMAVAHYYQKHKPEKLHFKWAVNGQSSTVTTDKPLYHISLPHPDDPARVTVKNLTGKDIWVRITRRGKPMQNQEPQPEQSHLALQVTYKRPDGTPIDPSVVTRGTELVAEVTVSRPANEMGQYRNLALTQVFPAGWEINNVRMTDFDDTAPSNYDYRDIRDDRVLTYFDLNRNQTITFHVSLTAAYPGKFYLPGAYCEAMYDHDIRARTAGRWVSVR